LEDLKKLVGQEHRGREGERVAHDEAGEGGSQLSRATWAMWRIREHLILKGLWRVTEGARDKCMHSVCTHTDYRMEKNVVGKRKGS